MANDLAKRSAEKSKKTRIERGQTTKVIAIHSDGKEIHFDSIHDAARYCDC